MLLPYLTAEYKDNEEYFKEFYDYVCVSSAAEKAHPKAAIQIRNNEMVDRADLIICFIENNSGGACKAIKYAQRQHKEIINIAEK